MARNNPTKLSAGGVIKNSIEHLLKLDDYDGQFFLLYPHKKEIGARIREYDPISRRIYLLVFFIATFGAVIQYSASCYMCANDDSYGNDPMYFLKKQIFYLAVGFFFTWVVEHVNYQIFLSRLAYVAYFGSIGSILLLMIPSISITANGATRWIRLGPIAFAPSELVKVTVVIMLAYVIQKRSAYLRRPETTALLWLIGGVPAVMLWKIGNNLSSCMVVLFITFGVSLLVTRTWKMHLFAVVCAFIVAFMMVYPLATNMPTTEELLNMSFRQQRIVAWLAPEDYYDTKGWQVANTLYAVGSGGFFGNGLGSFQRLGTNVPYAYTDVIFSVIVYELGVFGALIFLALYVFLSYQIMKVCVNAESLFGSILCGGYMVHICVQVLLHVAVVLNLMPNTGQTLPWVSYSGTTFLCLGLEIGFILSVARQHYYSYAVSELQVEQ